MITCFGKYISILYRQEQKHINRAMKQYGLGFSSYNFLLFISANEGCSQKQLCQILSIDEALAARTMKKLAAQGFITREKESKNQHYYELYLTERGRDMIPMLKTTLNEWWDSLNPELNQKQKEFLLEQLKHMSEKALTVYKD